MSVSDTLVKENMIVALVLHSAQDARNYIASIKHMVSWKNFRFSDLCLGNCPDGAKVVLLLRDHSQIALRSYWYHLWSQDFNWGLILVSKSLSGPGTYGGGQTTHSEVLRVNFLLW